MQRRCQHVYPPKDCILPGCSFVSTQTFYELLTCQQLLLAGHTCHHVQHTEPGRSVGWREGRRLDMQCTSNAGRQEDKLLSCTSISWSRCPWPPLWWDCSSIRQPACMGRTSLQSPTSPSGTFLAMWYDFTQLVHGDDCLSVPQQLAYQVGAMASIPHLDSCTIRSTGPPVPAC